MKTLVMEDAWNGEAAGLENSTNLSKTMPVVGQAPPETQQPSRPPPVGQTQSCDWWIWRMQVLGTDHYSR